ncbi:polysaccharide deacetylase family protein [Halobacillus litoralis]|uniref:polysaccharide deacetylase family protein n=1 Tax=Halobacillus litoralis TaxID=45668 RepID=UPI001CFCFC97|nr:polysaccharide deacetylase family protein [Halobacillus litoralis]
MKRWTTLLILMVLLLAACSNDSDEAQGETEETGTENTTETEETVEEKEAEEAAAEPEEEAAEKEEVNKEVAKAKEPEYEWRDNGYFKPIDDANPQVVLLTFDDAPDKYALEIAETLKKNNAPAIFFVNGHFLDSEEGKEQLKKIHEMGFAIGNHTETHPIETLKGLSKEEQREEILSTSDKIESIIGERPVFFRAPNGANTEYSTQLAKEEGMLVMNWTYGYDYFEEYMNAEALTDIMVNTELLNYGANLLMHDREWTNKALGDIMKGLRDKGYEFLDPALIKTP